MTHESYQPLVNAPGSVERYNAVIVTDCGRDHDTRHHPVFPSFRLLVCFISFLGFVCAQGSQALVGASLLLMVRLDRAAAASEGVNVTEVSNDSSADSHDKWHFRWSRSEQGWLISAYFVSYYFMQFPVGFLVGRFGGYRLLLISSSIIAGCQVLSIWVPLYGWLPFAFLFMLSGGANAFSIASVVAVMARWCPPNESTRLMGLIVSGNSVGIAFVFCVSTGTVHIGVMGGWPFNFIIMATTEVIFLLLWTVLVTNAPEENKVCSASEVTYIYNSLKSQASTTSHSSAVPWFKILTSPPVYAICASMFAVDWVMYSVMSAFPAYFIAQQNMSASTVSLLTGLPFVFVPFVSFAISFGVDSLRERQILSTTTLRKIADVIGKVVSGSSLLIAAYLPANYTALTSVLYVVSILVALAFQGSSWAPNVAELSPRRAGVVMTVAQVVSVPTSFIAPLLFGAITPNNSVEEWQACFLITFAVCILATVVYVVFGTSLQQPWDDEI